ncbi:hypothetical protein HDU79_008601 [Rhizoclosmatium sp. JEL0117]|nr:hypothetical protein HDU79_008601 [Rhizoclosmatium sp. JEL0117]
MVLAFVTYACFFAVLLELMVMLPFNGGMAIFARTAFGPFAGFLIGSCEAWEYILFAAQGFWMIGETCSQVFATDPNYAPLYWIPFGIMIFAANMAGVRVFVVVCAVLLFINVFGGMSVVLPSLAFFNPRKYAVDDAINLGFFNITEGEAMPSTVALLWPTGSKPIWPGMVSMLWSVSGLEMAPLVAEEGKDFVKNAPRLMKYALLSIFSVLAYVIVLVPCVPPGVSTLVNANDPMIDAFLASYNYDSLTDNGTVARVLYFVLFVPDIMLFIAIYVYATSRQIFALSKVGYYPTFVAKVHVKSKTPIYALVCSMAMSLGAALVLQFEASGVAGQAFLNGSLLYAIFAYIAVAFAYLKMRWYYPNLKRPFDLGPIVGPLCAIIVVTSYMSALANLFQKEIFRDTLIVCISKLGVMMLVFVVYQRKRMVETPEELFIQRYLDEAAVGDGSRRDGVDAGAWMRDVREELLEQQARKEREMGENQKLEDVTFLRESHVTKA